MAKTDWATGDKLTADAMNALGTEVTGKADKSEIPTIPAATAAGTAAQLTAGTDTTVRAFSAKDISDFVIAKIAELAEPKAG